jgi:hydrogenase nickel incorporation protein HypA/HybF
MHEATVAQSLLDAICAEARKQNARPLAAKISCGVLNGINDEILRFAFDAISKGTICEGVKLDIEQKPIQARCRKCDYTFTFDLQSPACPKCRRDDFELLPDAPLMLEELELEEK